MLTMLLPFVLGALTISVGAHDTDDCPDIAPPEEIFDLSCPDISRADLCGAPFVIPYCWKTCHNNICPYRCSDVPPDDRYSCEEQERWGKCSAPFMQVPGYNPMVFSYCQRTCGHCPPGSDGPIANTQSYEDGTHEDGHAPASVARAPVRDDGMGGMAPAEVHEDWDAMPSGDASASTGGGVGGRRMALA